MVSGTDSKLGARAEATHQLARFFLDREFAVSFQSPNLLVVTGSKLGLIKALGHLSRDPALGCDWIEDTCLCAGAWSPPRH